MTREQTEDSEDKRIAEAIREADALFESDDDMSDWVRVPARVSKTPRHVFSLKIGAGELDEIADAAEAEGVSVGAFVRTAALEKARARKPAGEIDVEVALAQMSAQLSSLAERVRLGSIPQGRPRARTRTRSSK